MAARVIHYGWDECHRVAVLRSAGYEVKESHALSALWLDLQRDEQIDAVIVAEGDEQDAEQAANLIHQHHRLAPVIVFRRHRDLIDESKFARVYTSCVPPEIWISETQRLIRESRYAREQSGRLRMEAQAVRVQCSRERARSSMELERNKDTGNLWGRRLGDD